MPSVRAPERRTTRVHRLAWRREVATPRAKRRGEKALCIVSHREEISSKMTTLTVCGFE